MLNRSSFETHEQYTESLRDYFAGQALANVNAVDVDQAALLCYQVADAMLRAREE